MINRFKTAILIVVIALYTLTLGCTWAGEGTVRIKETTSGYQGVVKPSDGIVGDGPMTSFHDFSTRSFTTQVDAQGQTKDNARLTVKVQVTAVPPQDGAEILSFARKYGVTDEERNSRLMPVLTGQISTEAKNAISEYDAYALQANLENVQKRLLTSLTPIFKQQMWLTLESVQILGSPDFLDDRIETAASAVVANQKEKEAAEARLATAKVEAEKKAVEAQTFKDPALFQIKMLELQLQIEQARAAGISGHNGSLTIINGNTPTQLQLKQQ